MPAVVDFRRLGDDFSAFVADPTSETSVAYAERNGLKVSHTRDIRGKRYHIVRYDKKKYVSDGDATADVDETPSALKMTDEIAMLRSVIIADGKIRSFSLPKATRTMDDFQAVSVSSSSSASPTRAHNCKSVLLEGPMINVFYYQDDESQGEDATGKGWQITTRSVFGARNSYYDDDDGSKLTFRNMFLEAMPADHFNTLDRGTVYSYVIRHPKNRDVYGVTQPYIVLVASFRPCDDTNMVWTYTEPDVAGVLAATNDPAMGVTAAWADENGFLVRAKKLNDEYHVLRQLRGTQPKLKYHFLTLRKQQGAITKYLTQFPEHTDTFNAFRNEIHHFTKQLQANYWESFVRRVKPLKDYDGRYKSHMYNLHSQFKANRKPVLMSTVIKYVNNLEPAQLMFSLNWEHRVRRDTRNVASTDMEQ